MTAIPPGDWPKPWLLRIHQEAVAAGYVLLHPITREDAVTLRHRLYRMRRRSDTSMAAYILPEYHMVMVGTWVPDNGGTLPIIYNALPNNQQLPNITPVDAETFATIQPAQATPASSAADGVKPTFTPPPDFNPQLEPSEVSSFVDKLRKKARQHDD